MLEIERSSAPQFFGLPYLHMVIDGMAWHFLIEPQSNDKPTRDRPISQDPTNADRSLQLFLPPHILQLCNVWQHLNTCASQVMQAYASRRIALNKSRLKILAHVSLNANCLFTSGCLLLFTFNYVFMPQKFYFIILH